MSWLRDLFRVSWVSKGSGRWQVCGYCKGAGEVDLATQRPIGPQEQNANAIECRSCTGMGRKWIPHNG